jgi:hypothetical protein
MEKHQAEIKDPKAKATIESMDDGRNVKCPRCWHWHGVRENFDNLCDSCCKVILADFPNHPSVAHIRAAYDAQARKYGIKPTPASEASSP